MIGSNILVTYLLILLGFVFIPGPAVLLTSALLFVAAGLLATMVVAVGAGRVSALLRRNAAVVKWQGKVVGSIYCALGMRVALQEK